MTSATRWLRARLHHASTPPRPLFVVCCGRTCRDATGISVQGLSVGPAKTRMGPGLACERDGVDVAPVVGLGAVGRAAVRVELRRVGVGAQADVLDLRNARARKARGDVSRQIEHGMALALGW